MTATIRWDLDITPEELEDMALDVDERAGDLAEYGDPRDYDEPDGLQKHVDRLEKVANVLRYLAARLREARAG